jgi:hypothetical protein
VKIWFEFENEVLLRARRLTPVSEIRCWLSKTKKRIGSNPVQYTKYLIMEYNEMKESLKGQLQEIQEMLPSMQSMQNDVDFSEMDNFLLNEAIIHLFQTEKALKKIISVYMNLPFFERGDLVKLENSNEWTEEASLVVGNMYTVYDYNILDDIGVIQLKEDNVGSTLKFDFNITLFKKV